MLHYQGCPSKHRIAQELLMLRFHLLLLLLLLVEIIKRLILLLFFFGALLERP